MLSDNIDPIVKRAVADGVLQRAATELDRLLHELTSALDPFPTFMGTSSIQALEVDPAGVADPERGCVVVCPDGKLRELVLRMMPGPFDLGGFDQTEEFKELDLSPGDYVAYAYSAVVELARVLEERQG